MSLAGSSTEIVPLTGLRGVAALWVVCFHAWSTAGAPRLSFGPVDLTPFFQCGYFGVDLFFVLSGFLLALPFLRARAQGTPPPSWRRFWRHRCRRVLPAYWGQLLVLMVVALSAGDSPSTVLDPLRVVTHISLTMNLAPGVELYNGVYWSLPIEWDFYVVLPLLLWVVLRTPALLSLAGFVALSIAVRVLVLPVGAQGGVEETLAVQLPARLDQFVIGMLAARAYLARGSAARPTLLLGVALVSLGFVVSIAADYGFEVGSARPWFFLHYTATAAALGLLVYACALGSPLATYLFGNQPLRFFGENSYSLYLWHAPFLLWAASLPSRQDVPTWAILSAALLAGLAVSLISHRLLERPFQPRRRVVADAPVASWEHRRS